jgi:hypothetical protein
LGDGVADDSFGVLAFAAAVVGIEVFPTGGGAPYDGYGGRAGLWAVVNPAKEPNHSLAFTVQCRRGEIVRATSEAFIKWMCSCYSIALVNLAQTGLKTVTTRSTPGQCYVIITVVQ